MQDLADELGRLRNSMNAALAVAKERGIALAEAESVYRIALAKYLLSAREKKIPTSILHDVSRGDEGINLLRKRRDIAKVLYTNAVEAINTYKLNVRLVNAEIERVWHSGSE